MSPIFTLLVIIRLRRNVDNSLNVALPTDDEANDEEDDGSEDQPDRRGYRQPDARISGEGCDAYERVDCVSRCAAGVEIGRFNLWTGVDVNVGVMRLFNLACIAVASNLEDNLVRLRSMPIEDVLNLDTGVTRSDGAFDDRRAVSEVP